MILSLDFIKILLSKILSVPVPPLSIDKGYSKSVPSPRFSFNSDRFFTPVPPYLTGKVP